MKIVDILIDASLLLGLNEEVEILKTTTVENEAETLINNSKIANLFNLIKYSIRELVSNYIPMQTSLKIATDAKEFPIAHLENFVRINSLCLNGEQVKFKILNHNIVVEEDAEYDLTYATYPNILSVMDEIDYLSNFNPEVITFGLCAYYSLANGMFSEFESFHDKYTTRAESLRTFKSFDLPARRWE